MKMLTENLKLIHGQIHFLETFYQTLTDIFCEAENPK